MAEFTPDETEPLAATSKAGQQLSEAGQELSKAGQGLSESGQELSESGPELSEAGPEFRAPVAEAVLSPPPPPEAAEVAEGSRTPEAAQPEHGQEFPPRRAELPLGPQLADFVARVEHRFATLDWSLDRLEQRLSTMMAAAEQRSANLVAAVADTTSGHAATNRVLAGFMEAVDRRFSRSELAVGETNQTLTPFVDAVSRNFSTLGPAVSDTNHKLAAFMDAVYRHFSIVEAAVAETTRAHTETNRVLAGFMEAVDRRFSRLEAMVTETSRSVASLPKPETDGLAHSVNWLVQEGFPRLLGIAEKTADDVVGLKVDVRQVKGGVEEAKRGAASLRGDISLLASRMTEAERHPDVAT
jgi:hypothetical protein